MAAHRSLPFGTVLRVTNLQNGRDVLVRINDRGPFSPRLGLDVSQAAARELNMIRAGVVRVQTEVVSDPSGRPLLPDTGFYVDLGTISKPTPAREKAEIDALNDVRKKARLTGAPEVRTFTKAMPDKKGRRFVGMGPFATFAEAEKVYKGMKKHWPRARVVCATMAKDANVRLVASVVADDIPKAVAEYKGKQKASASKEKSSKRSSRKSGAVNSGSSSRKSGAVASGSSQSRKAAVATSQGTRSAPKATGSVASKSGKKGDSKAGNVSSSKTSSGKTSKTSSGKASSSKTSKTSSSKTSKTSTTSSKADAPTSTPGTVVAAGSPSASRKTASQPSQTPRTSGTSRTGR